MLVGRRKRSRDEQVIVSNPNVERDTQIMLDSLKDLIKPSAATSSLQTIEGGEQFGEEVSTFGLQSFF